LPLHAITSSHLMKLLLDECVPHRIGRLFQDHETAAVARAGFAGMKNGQLLQAAAASGFEVLLSVDQNLLYQQNLKGLDIAVVIMKAKRIKYETLAPLAPEVLKALAVIKRGEIVVIENIFG